LKFYVEEFSPYIERKGKEFPCVVLVTDSWDDWFEAETLFHAKYLKNESSILALGDVKIMTTEGGVTRNYIEAEFTSLGEDFCSLGQTLNYYKSIGELPSNTQTEILLGLRDSATNNVIAEKFQEKRIFINSLLRFSEAEKAFKEAKKFFGGSVSQVLNFTYECHIANATSPHIIELDFDENEIPYRINAFVGKNATGKTKVLTELSSALSGAKKKKQAFYPERPSFSKVITISYSAFDDLYKPFEDKELEKKEEIDPTEQSEDRKEGTKLFSYKYCGLRKKQGILSLEELESQFLQSFSEVKARGREEEWLKIIKNVFEDEHLDLIYKIIEMKSDISLASSLSSGQNILLSTITDVIANIETDSLLLFDEPEIHLHPNAIANFMRMFYEILERFNSYAILSTHSPIILQEIPSKYIRVFTRIDNTPLIHPPSLECFGENISNITNDVFEIREHESNYKMYFKFLSNRFSDEQIIEMFNNELSFNALTYLNTIYKRKETE
jgi:ABC-type multidrug transport system ATPase subunit